MNLTYRQLLNKLMTLSEEQLNQNVCMYDGNNDEVIPLTFSDIVGQEDEQNVRPDSDILDEGHFYLGHM